MRLFLTILLIINSFAITSCALLIPASAIDVTPTIAHFGYATAVDQRSIGDMVSDKDLSLRLKKEIMHIRAKDGFFLNIYVYKGRVFLVGDPPEDFQEPTVRFAIRLDGVESIDYCFFPHNSGNVFSDFMTGCSLRTNLILESGINSSWVDTEVYAGHAVLMGVVEEEEDVKQIVALAQNTSGVRGVINFLLVEGKPYTPPPDAEVILY